MCTAIKQRCKNNVCQKILSDGTSYYVGSNGPFCGTCSFDIALFSAKEKAKQPITALDGKPSQVSLMLAGKNEYKK